MKKLLLIIHWGLFVAVGVASCEGKNSPPSVADLNGTADAGRDGGTGDGSALGPDGNAEGAETRAAEDFASKPDGLPVDENVQGADGDGGLTADRSGDDGRDLATADEQADAAPQDGIVDVQTGWSVANEWSWDGSWQPASGDFPMNCLFDDEYNDGHLVEGQPSPLLPPGEWDYQDENNDLANWRNFSSNLGTFDRLLDSQGRHFGWRLAALAPAAVDYQGPAMYFLGSCGADVLDLGGGAIHSFGTGQMGDGPDILIFRQSWSLDFRTGSDLTGAAQDNDLVVAGGAANNGGDFDVMTTTVHTGPGSDWVFVRDISRAAVDLGDGQNGRTDATDPQDSDDLVVLRGNTHDFRVMGGNGNDIAVWFVDENVQTTFWLGPAFFGGGGFGDALWQDQGIDRLVMAIPEDTPIVVDQPVPDGTLGITDTGDEVVLDDPTQGDPYARYCIECGVSPDGRKTVQFEYRSADGAVQTGYFYVTGFEEIQIGVSPQARVYAIDDRNATLTQIGSATPFIPPAWPEPGSVWGAIAPTP